ncbi:MAG: hypothetical protein WBO17_11245 [Sphingorhabdus sp.]
MSRTEFTPEICLALDTYEVPPLPSNFTHRLMARIEAGDPGAKTPAAQSPGQSRFRRVSSTSAWRRSGRILGSLAILSFATATAAAAGIFGNPIYVPGVSEVLVEAKIMAPPRQFQIAKPKLKSTAAPERNAQTQNEPNISGKTAVVERINSLRRDPLFESLGPREKLVAARREIRTIVLRGDATAFEARAAVQELMRTADPQTKAKWAKALETRRAARSKRAQSSTNSTQLMPDPQASAGKAPHLLPAPEPMPSNRLPISDISASPAERWAALRERLQNSSPEQRAQFRRAISEQREQQFSARE